MEDKMPGQDGTGPAGQGAMTGRGMGFCTGFMNSGFGRGMGRGFGRGRGFGWRARAMQVMPIQRPAVITEKQEKQFLEQELTALKEEMKEIEERLKELKQ
jgi:hypothetical protein